MIFISENMILRVVSQIYQRDMRECIFSGKYAIIYTAAQDSNKITLIIKYVLLMYLAHILKV